MTPLLVTLTFLQCLVGITGHVIKDLLFEVKAGRSNAVVACETKGKATPLLLTNLVLL